jgi:S1-C subfamily serine protease
MKSRCGWYLAFTLAVLGATATSAQQQSDADAEARREVTRARDEMARAQAEVARQMAEAREQFARSNVEAERQMAEARRQLEQAARELARLSEQQRAEYVRAGRGSIVYGGRVVLGVNLDTEPSELGARVAAVTPNGPAANAGVIAGDVIVAIDGTDLTGAGPPSPSQRLVEQTRDLEPGATVTLRVLRDGDYRDLVVETRLERWGGNPSLVTVTPGPSPQWRVRAPWDPFGVAAWGNLELVPLTPGLGSYFGVDEGLLVVRASENRLGFRDGDVILDIGGREPTNAEHALRIMSSFEPGEMLRVTIMRERRRETLEVLVPTADVYTEWTRGRSGV